MLGINTMINKTSTRIIYFKIILTFNFFKMKKSNMNEKQICDILNLTKAELKKLIED